MPSSRGSKCGSPSISALDRFPRPRLRSSLLMIDDDEFEVGGFFAHPRSVVQRYVRVDRVLSHAGPPVPERDRGDLRNVLFAQGIEGVRVEGQMVSQREVVSGQDHVVK